MTQRLSPRSVVIDGIDIEYEEAGSGPALVFVHGAYMSGAVWDDVIPILAERHRCIIPTWPFGAQRKPAGGAELTIASSGRRIAGLLRALDIRNVTLIASDAGGGVVLAALGNTTPDGLGGDDRIARLVFTNCDSFDHFPRRRYAPMVWTCRLSPRVGATLLRGLTTRWGRTFFVAQLSRHGISDARLTAILGGLTKREIRCEAARFTADLSPRHTLRAAADLKCWEKPVLLIWGVDDAMFPLSDARRLVAAFPDASLHVVPESSTLVMIDRPEETSSAITDFVAGQR